MRMLEKENRLKCPLTQLGTQVNPIVLDGDPQSSKFPKKRMWTLNWRCSWRRRRIPLLLRNDNGSDSMVSDVLFCSCTHGEIKTYILVIIL
jgi:hypothetical protein